MKRKRLTLIFIIFFLKIISYGESNFSFHSHSFHLFSNPSLIVLQQGVPFSTDFTLQSKTDHIEGKGALSLINNKNAFSFGYEKNKSIKNRLISGYSVNNNIFYFGTSFSFLFDSHYGPDLLLDAAATLKVYEKKYISLVLNNLIGTDTIQRLKYPQAGISFFGTVPKVDKNLGFDITYYSRLLSLKDKKIEHGGKILILGSFKKEPLIYYSFGYEVYGKKVNSIILTDIGFQIPFNDLTTGILYGIKYNTKLSDYSMKLALNFNPLNFDNSPPVIQIEPIKGEENNFGVYVSINCSNTKKNKIKNWVLMFSSLPSNEGKVIKSFSGGDIPPSTIHWDLHDYTGNIYDQQKIYIRAVISDYRNNISSTPWIEFKL